MNNCIKVLSEYYFPLVLVQRAALLTGQFTVGNFVLLLYGNLIVVSVGEEMLNIILIYSAF